MEAVSLMGHIIKETAEMTGPMGSVVPGWWYSAMRLRIIPLWPGFSRVGARRLSISISGRGDSEVVRGLPDDLVPVQ